MKSKTIILSIHPQHIEKILTGEKQYEYRKRIPLEIEHIIVYATSPIKKIVAIINVATIIKGTPSEVWDKTKNHSGISEDFFSTYFKGHQESYAIKFNNVYELPIPKSITDIIKTSYAPQSYIYVNTSIQDIYRLLGIG